jgi:hypothetical protein
MNRERTVRIKITERPQSGIDERLIRVALTDNSSWDGCTKKGRGFEKTTERQPSGIRGRLNKVT